MEVVENSMACRAAVAMGPSEEVAPGALDAPSAGCLPMTYRVALVPVGVPLALLLAVALRALAQLVAVALLELAQLAPRCLRTMRSPRGRR